MKKIFILFIIAMIFVSVIYTSFATSKFGSSGEEVKQIQKKLKDWGYYKR